MGEKFKHPGPDSYAKDLEDALDEFEEALRFRYEVDLEERYKVWTTHGEEPLGVTPTRDQYDTAREQAPGWAADARDWVSRSIVDWGTQNLYLIEMAFDDLHSAAARLGEGRAVGKPGNIPELENEISHRCDFAAWAGASGEAFKDNFGRYTRPAMDNQAIIATNLLNLYSARACIIDGVRRNTITALKSAAKALRETEDSGEENEKWLVLGVTISLFGGPVLGVAGAIAGFLDAKDPEQEFSNDIEEIVNTLEGRLRQAGSDARSEEDELFDKVTEMQEDIASASSNELELYDFTGGEYSPTAPAGGFEVSAVDVYTLSALCFEVSQEYEKVIAHVTLTDIADSELKGEGHVETAADADLIDTKDALVSFLKTTCARYYEASERLHDTARDYFGVEADNEEVLKGVEEELKDLKGEGLKEDVLKGLEKGLEEPDLEGGSVDKHVEESNRDEIEDPPDPDNIKDHHDQEDPGKDDTEDSEQSAGGVEYGAGGA